MRHQTVFIIKVHIPVFCIRPGIITVAHLYACIPVAWQPNFKMPISRPKEGSSGHGVAT